MTYRRKSVTCIDATLLLILKITPNSKGLEGGIVKVEVKQSRLQAWIGPEGSRKLRFPDFMTTAHDGGKVVSLTRRPPLPPGNIPGTHFC